ncbi:MAG: PDZ domain-containing protein [Planctomycetota bacterium]|nr:PDZ domain-containing protein [Planctomycetota bacterium]
MNRAIQSGLTAALFGIAGLAAGVLIIGEPKTEIPARQQFTIDAKLRKNLSELHSSVKQLQLEVKELKSSRPLPRASTPLSAVAKTTALPSVPMDPSSMASMAAKIRELETKLAMSLRSTNELSSEELQEKFSKAVEKEDGKGAMEALIALSKAKDYGAFTRCYGEMKAANWLGLRGADKRGWGSSGLFHWILTSNTLGVEGETATELQKTALESLRRSDQDMSKVVGTLAFFIANQAVPEAMPEETGKGNEKDARRNKRNRRRGEKGGQDKKGPKDLYRLALLQLVRIKDSAAIPPLGQVLNNAKNPTDVRITAMRGLIRQEDAAGVQTVEGVLSDPNETVRRQAEIALQVKAPAVSGFLVTNVGKESPAASAGLSSGQIITAIDGKAVKSGKDLQKALKKIENGKSLAITVYSNGASSTVTLTKQGKRSGLSGRSVAVKAAE